MAFSEVDTTDRFVDYNPASTGNVTKSTGTANGDIAIIAVSWFESVGGIARTINTPSGFTSQGTMTCTGTAPNRNFLTVFTRICDGSEGASYTVSFSDTVFACAVLITLRSSLGAITFGSATQGTGATGTTCTAPSVSGTSGQALVCPFGYSDPTTVSTPAGMTVGPTGGTVTNGATWFWETLASTGATGTRVSTLGTSRDNGAWSILLTEPGGPTITAQPVSTTKNAGQTATFNITATGTGTLHYQWKDDGSNVGTDSDSYTTGTLTNSDQWAAITCVVTDDAGSTTSSTAVLTIAFAAAGTGPRRRNILGAYPIGSLGWLGVVSSGSVSAAAYSAGVATDIAVGSSTVQANALSSAVSTALAIGAALTSADAYTQGTSTAQGVGATRISGDAYTQGTSTAQAVGSSSASTESDAYSEGVATDIATGQSTVAAVGFTQGAATDIATGQSTVASDAYTQGTSTAQAVGSTGAAATTAEAYSAGASTAQATGAIIVQAAGYSAGTSTAQAVGTGGAAGNTIIRLGARNPWAVKKGMDTVDQENEEILQLLAELVPLISMGHMHHASR